MSESMTFGRLAIAFDDRVLRPRPWTLAQSEWGATLAERLPPGPVLELCAGVGHIGLAMAARTGRDLVLVDADPHAGGLARRNAAATGLPGVEVRVGPVDGVLEPGERFPLVLADPPWVRSDGTAQFPADPLTAIDGGADGLDVARACVEVIGRHLDDHGAAILQLGDVAQVTAIGRHLDGRRDLGLVVAEVRIPEANGVLVLLTHPAGP